MKYLWIILSFMLLMSPFGCSGSGGGNHLAPGMHSVKYEVDTETQNVNIVYRDENGNDQERDNEDSHNKPWTYSFSAKDGAHLSLSAQLLGERYDTILVTIYVDNLTVQQQSSFGSSVGALVEYDIPISD